MALRLGYADPCEMVDEVPKETLEKYLATVWLEGEPWEHIGWLAMQIRNSVLLLAAKMGHGCQNNEIKPAREYMPEYAKPLREKSEQPVDGGFSESWMRQMAGFDR